MEVKKYSNLFDFDIQSEHLLYIHPTTKENCSMDISNVLDEYICELKVKNRLLATINDYLIIYVKDNKIYITNINQNKIIYDVKVKNLNRSDISLSFKNGYIAQIKMNEKLLFELDDFFAHNFDEKIIVKKFDKDFHLAKNERQRYIGLSNINYNNIKIFITYDRFLQEVKLIKSPFSIEYVNNIIKLELLNANNLKIRNKENENEQIVNINKVGITPTPISDVKLSEGLKNEHIIAYFSFKNKRYFIYNQLNGIHIMRSNAKLMSKYRSILMPLSTRKSFYLFGLYKHNAYKAKHKYDTIYIQNKNNKIGKFYRPFKNFKVLNQLVVGKISFNSIKEMNRIHSNLLCGSDDYVLHNISLNSFSKPMKTHKAIRYSENTMVLRNNLAGNLTLTSIPFSPEYKLTSKIKIALARFSNKFRSKKGVNLFFEKKSERAEESAIQVFNETIKTTNEKDNFFVLDKKAEYYNELKKKYGKKLIKKYSYKHFNAIYNSNYFISSELPNHLINDRLYIDSLRDKIMQTPSVFLQHGIMFAKPVDNPMAFGFHKQYNKYNNIKNVISSDLEAEQFYKMGYNNEDLIKTGLATFDSAKLNEDADKIAYMPTYRYWEERLIYSGDITKTSYFQSIMKIIKAFEKNNLLEKLLIVPHNKFSEFIYDNMPEYRNIIEPNPSNALKSSIIFITDYSSAIYDSIFRGAYPIFYWEEKDYLIENYKAIPPVNELNAPGPIAKNVEDILIYVKNAIKRDYELEDKYKYKYLQINEFSDRQNTKRIVDELKKAKII